MDNGVTRSWLLKTNAAHSGTRTHWVVMGACPSCIAGMQRRPVHGSPSLNAGNPHLWPVSVPIPSLCSCFNKHHIQNYLSEVQEVRHIQHEVHVGSPASANYS